MHVCLFIILFCFGKGRAILDEIFEEVDKEYAKLKVRPSASKMQAATSRSISIENRLENFVSKVSIFKNVTATYTKVCIEHVPASRNDKSATSIF